MAQTLGTVNKLVGAYLVTLQLSKTVAVMVPMGPTIYNEARLSPGVTRGDLIIMGLRLVHSPKTMSGTPPLTVASVQSQERNVVPLCRAVSRVH